MAATCYGSYVESRVANNHRSRGGWQRHHIMKHRGKWRIRKKDKASSRRRVAIYNAKRKVVEDGRQI